MILYNCHNNKQKNRSIFILIVILFSDIEGKSMSRAGDLIEYSYNDDDIQRLHKLIKNTMDEYFEILYKYVNNFSTLFFLISRSIHYHFVIIYDIN